jgi:hypothetical protein
MRLTMLRSRAGAPHRFGGPDRQQAMTQSRKHVRIEYRVRPEVDLDELKRDIATFVAGIAGHRDTSRYSSFQDAKDPRHFVHVGAFDEDAVPSLQRQEFFVHFTQRLRERCEVAPEATMLVKVASTS